MSTQREEPEQRQHLYELVARYVDAWNDPDPKKRRQKLGAIYIADGHIVTKSGDFAGIEAVVEHIAAVFNEFIASGRYSFRSGGAVGHHECVLFRWEMIHAGTGRLADAGMNLFVLSPDGRIRDDYQFALGVDSSIGSAATTAR